MRLWCDIYNAAGTRLGAGPLFQVISATIKRRLDGAGSFEVELPLTDRRVVDLVQNERRIRIFLQDRDDYDPREIGRGVIRNKKVDVSDAEFSMFISGPDDMVELTFPNIGRGLIFEDDPLGDIVDDLVALASGWTADSDMGLGNYSTRIDGGNPLAAVIKLAEQNGLHIRPALTAKTLEFGAFGDALGLRAYGPISNLEAVQNNDNLLIIDRLSVVSDSSNLINWMELRGGGEGDTAIDLQGLSASRGTGFGDAYDIQSTTKNGRTIYYIADASSIATYGQIEETMIYKNLVPISNSATDLLACRNAIFDAGVADLIRMKDPLYTYRLTLKKPRQTIRPGDKIRVQYTGIVEREDGSELTYVSIDDEFWIMTLDERISGDSITLTLDVASIDRHALDAVETVVGAIEQQQVRSVAIQPYRTTFSYVFARVISSEDGGFNATVPVKFDNSVLQCNRCKIQLTTRPFQSTAKNALHRHLMFDHISASGDLAGNQIFSASVDAEGTGTTTVVLPVASAPGDIFTSSEDGEINYGVYNDTTYPGDVGIIIDGVDRTSALGGPWGDTSTPVDEELNITQYLDTPIQQTHILEFFCATGRGEIEVIVNNNVDEQSLSVT